MAGRSRPNHSARAITSARARSSGRLTLKNIVSGSPNRATAARSISCTAGRLVSTIESFTNRSPPTSSRPLGRPPYRVAAPPARIAPPRVRVVRDRSSGEAGTALETKAAPNGGGVHFRGQLPLHERGVRRLADALLQVSAADM